MSKIKHKSRERRRTNYERLRAVGFTSREADRIKDYADARIDTIIDLRKKHNAEMGVIVNDNKEYQA